MSEYKYFVDYMNGYYVCTCLYGTRSNRQIVAGPFNNRKDADEKCKTMNVEHYQNEMAHDAAELKYRVQ